jgi:CubicO group peptidase (beta-lactamase class C family)
MPSSLPRSTPADQRVDPAAILSFLDAVDERPDIEMHSLMVVRHGQVVAEGWWAPYSAERPQLLYSLSKSFTSTAAAFAQAEGLLDLDDAVVSHFAEFAADITDPRSRSVKVRHVASMAAGHTREMLTEAIMRDPEEPVRGFLLIPPDREPGTVFAYSQPCTYALASIIQRNAGMPLTRYLRPRLFDPLGIGHVGWHTFPPGREQGFSGLHARTEDIAKLGLLYLQGGQWEGAQLIGEKWVAEATSQQVANPAEPNPDWRQGYGFQFWMSRHGYRGDGAFGQFCVILPEQDTVIATTACTPSSTPCGTACCRASARSHPAPPPRTTSSVPGSPASNCPPVLCLPILGLPTLARRHPPTGIRGPVGRLPSPPVPQAPRVSPS